MTPLEMADEAYVKSQFPNAELVTQQFKDRTVCRVVRGTGADGAGPKLPICSWWAVYSEVSEGAAAWRDAARQVKKMFDARQRRPNENKQIVIAKYPKAFVETRRHDKRPYRIHSGPRPDGQPSKDISGWKGTAAAAWMYAASYVLSRILVDTESANDSGTLDTPHSPT